jgi:benzodiazapine receptor
MTTYIPSLTLPAAIFENAALSVLFPIVAGTAVGFSTQRKDRRNNKLRTEMLTTS